MILYLFLIGANFALQKGKTIFLGIWGIGLATRSAALNSVPVIANCWVLRQDGQLVANGEVLGKLDESIDEGDCIVWLHFIIFVGVWSAESHVSKYSFLKRKFQGVAFDHIELKFYKNGVLLPLSISNVKGQVSTFSIKKWNRTISLLFLVKFHESE